MFLVADYRPPIRRGDLVSLPGGAVVGIIDGVFDQDLAISPREIRSALLRGVKIYGSSSMGALRATEVPGVVGIGQVYQMFRRGTLEDDDEVAIVFDAETSRALSEPMVNIRYAVERLVTPGTISQAAGAAIISAAKRLPYRDRRYKQILLEAGLGEREDASLLANMLGSYDLKRDDAITLLERLAHEPSPRTSLSDAEPPSSTSASFLGDEDDRSDTSAAVESFSPHAPVLFWEFGTSIPFVELVRFLGITGALSKHARAAVARYVLQGNALEIASSDGPTSEEVAKRVLDRLMAQWGFFTDEETRRTLADVGIGAAAFEECIDEEVAAQLITMSLCRQRSDEFLEALRVELFIDDLALKRATARLGSLRQLADAADKAPLGPQEYDAAVLKVCQLLDVRDRRDALRELSWWGYDDTDLDEFVRLLARARRGSVEYIARKDEIRKLPVRGIEILATRSKSAGDLRFSVSADSALVAAEGLCKRVGITRVAIITGLSDIGLPNAQAFRPDGHFSSTVGSGKSESVQGARVGAIMEEVEKWAQEQHSLRAVVSDRCSASYEQLRTEGRTVVDPRNLDLPYDTCFDPKLIMEWCPCYDLLSGQQCLVPQSALTMRRLAHDVYYSPRAGRKIFGTNGLASGFTLEDAVSHALCEYIERHNDVLNDVVEANPAAERQPRLRAVVPVSLPLSTQRLLAKIERTSRKVRVYDIRGDIRVPTFRARVATPTLADEQVFGVTHQVAWGKASHPNPEVAVNMAVLEAVQSVMTVTAGAREDLTVRSRSLGRHERTAAMTRAAFAARNGEAEVPQIQFKSIDGCVSDDVREDVRWTLQRVRDAGYQHVLLHDLSVGEIAPAVVVRILVPGLETVNPFHTGTEARLGLLRDLLIPVPRQSQLTPH